MLENSDAREHLNPLPGRCDRSLCYDPGFVEDYAELWVWQVEAACEVTGTQTDKKK